jgi:hypothetical protein
MQLVGTPVCYVNLSLFATAVSEIHMLVRNLGYIDHDAHCKKIRGEGALLTLVDRSLGIRRLEQVPLLRSRSKHRVRATGRRRPTSLRRSACSGGSITCWRSDRIARQLRLMGERSRDMSSRRRYQLHVGGVPLPIVRVLLQFLPRPDHYVVKHPPS